MAGALLAHGADINANGKAGTAPRWKIASMDVEMVQYLIDHDAKVTNSTARDTGRSTSPW